MSEEAIDENKMPLMDHLRELRTRLMYSAAAFVVAFALCFYFAKDIYAFLAEPLMTTLAERGQDTGMIYTALWEAFFTEIKVAFYAGLCLSFPFICYQLWIFIAPGLYKNEKSAFAPFLIATPFLFLLGAGMVYYAIFPLAWDFFLSFQSDGSDGSIRQELLPKINEYLAIVMKMIFAFGLAFELPVMLTLMAKVGLVSAKGLAKKRKYAIVIIVSVSAIITPPDVFSQIGLSVPLYALFEISIWLARMIERQREAKEEAFYAELRGETSSGGGSEGGSSGGTSAAYDDSDTLGEDGTDYNYARS